MTETTSEVMRVLAQAIDSFLNGDERGLVDERQIVFALLVFPLSQPEGARTNWVSNGERKDMIVALKEIVARFEGQAGPAMEFKHD